MTLIKITVDTEGNAAFDDNPNELKEVLIKVADKLKSKSSGTVQDSNGNSVASFVVEGL